MYCKTVSLTAYAWQLTRVRVDRYGSVFGAARNILLIKQTVQGNEETRTRGNEVMNRGGAGFRPRTH